MKNTSQKSLFEPKVCGRYCQRSFFETGSFIPLLSLKVVSYESIHPHNAVAIKEKRAEVSESSVRSNDQNIGIVLNPPPAG